LSLLVPVIVIVVATILEATRVLDALSQVKLEELIREFVPFPISNWFASKVATPVPPLVTDNVPKDILFAFIFVISLPEPIIEGTDVPPSPDVLPSPIQPCVIVPFILTLPKISNI